MNAISLIFINGRFSQELSNINSLPEDIEFRHEHGMFLRIPKNIDMVLPIHLKFLNDIENNAQSALQNTVILDENSKIILIEEYTGNNNAENYVTHTALKLYLNQYARLDYYKLQNENDTATHQANIIVEQKESSHANLFFADFGSRKSRVDLKVKLNERYAACQMRGLYFLNNDEQQVDNYIHVDHIAEYGKSAMLYKGVLDKKSRAVFNGKVHVHEGAQHVHAHQANHNLLLSPQAEVSTQPQLEIYADDVKCTHGATVGQLDYDSLFYLRSRGIEKNAALKLLTHAFIAEIMNKIEDPLMKQFVNARVSSQEDFYE